MKKIMSGNEAFAYGAYLARIKVGAGYPGTPSTEVLENFARYPGVYAEWSVNEKVALVKLYDCCPVTDGAAAVILACEEKARHLTDKPLVYIRGTG